MKAGINICIDLGASNIRGTWVDSSGEWGRAGLWPRPADLEGTMEVLSRMVEQIKKDNPGQVQGMGLASAGPMDLEKGLYLNPTNMPELQGFNVKKFFMERFGVKPVLENDAQASALGEAFMGCLRGEKDALVFTLGTGLGSGVVMNREIWKGKLVSGPELGHLYLGPGQRIRCGCGQTGCAETWLNARALKNLARQNNIQLPGLKDLDHILQQKDQRALKTMEQYGRRLGLYLSQVVAIFGIKKIGLSGGLSRLAPYFLSWTSRTMTHRLAARPWLIPEKICNSPDPEMSALWGMAFLINRQQTLGKKA